MEIPGRLTLDEAIRIFRARGLDLLIADANVRSAEADLRAAGAVNNPALGLSYGRVLNYDASAAGCDGCSANQYTVGISDQATLLDILSGKRGLRKDVARAAIEAARMGRADAQRQLEFQIKGQYLQVVAARAALDFAREVQLSAGRTLDLQKLRYPRVIDEGQLARFETAKLESDQAVDAAEEGVRQAQVGLAYLLGVRGRVPAFEVDLGVLKYAVPQRLSATSPDALLKEAYAHRPDLLAAYHVQERASASIDLAKRQRFPDIALSAQYSQTGTGQSAIQPPTVTFGVTAPIPIFYQQQGEVMRAEADYSRGTLARSKVEAQITSDVESAFAAFVASKKQVERMESGLLDRAKKARDITELQFNAGSATLIDFLDAQRTFIAANIEYLQDLTSYWTAVYQLELAVGENLRP